MPVALLRRSNMFIALIQNCRFAPEERHVIGNMALLTERNSTFLAGL